jgi:hypothetical protein
MKYSKTIILSLLLLASSKVHALEENLSPEEEAELAAALLASQNPQDIDPEMAQAIAASMAEAASQAFANEDTAGLTEDELRQIEALTKADQAFEASLEQLGEQGQYYQEISAPQILVVDGQQYTISQLFTLHQSKVSGRLAQGLPDDTCFAQATKNSAAIVAYRERADADALAPLAFMPAAQEALTKINQLLMQTEPPAGEIPNQDEFGNFDSVTVEFGSKMLTEGQNFGIPFLQNLIILNQKGLNSLIQPRTAEAQEADAQMLANGGAEFFNFYQISNYALNVIDGWRSGQINTIGIILQIEGHYIAVVFNKHNPKDIKVSVADSTFGVNRANDAWMTENVYLPLIELLQKTDLTPWLSALEQGRQAEEDQGPDFSLFD